MQPDGIAADREIRLENCQLVQSARAEGTCCEMFCFAGIAVAIVHYLLILKIKPVMHTCCQRRNMFSLNFVSYCKHNNCIKRCYIFM
jgi:hypothetical protein